MSLFSFMAAITRGYIPSLNFASLTRTAIFRVEQKVWKIKLVHMGIFAKVHLQKKTLCNCAVTSFSLQQEITKVIFAKVRSGGNALQKSQIYLGNDWFTRLFLQRCIDKETFCKGAFIGSSLQWSNHKIIFAKVYSQGIALQRCNHRVWHSISSAAPVVMLMWWWWSTRRLRHTTGVLLIIGAIHQTSAS